MYKLRPILRKLDACNSALDWLGRKKYKTFEEMINNCQRPDWLLWLAPAACVNPNLVFEASCDMAEEAFRLKLTPVNFAFVLPYLQRARDCPPRKGAESKLSGETPSLPYWVDSVFSDLHLGSGCPYFILIDIEDFEDCRPKATNLDLRTRLSDKFRAKISWKLLEQELFNIAVRKGIPLQR